MSCVPSTTLVAVGNQIWFLMVNNNTHTEKATTPGWSIQSWEECGIIPLHLPKHLVFVQSQVHPKIKNGSMVLNRNNDIWITTAPCEVMQYAMLSEDSVAVTGLHPAALLDDNPQPQAAVAVVASGCCCCCYWARSVTLFLHIL
jgi:hypothetical protein